MEKLINEVEELKKELDNTKQVKELKNINEKIMQDKNLLEDIKRYNETQSEEIKERILNNKLFREYKHKENEVNFLILEINQKLKEINNRNKGCQ